MRNLEVFNFKNWIDENRHLLKPPVGNKVVWPEGEFIIMVVGGPNARTDFHVNQGEEFFYQLEGEMVLKVVNENGKIQDLKIRAGDIFLLPANTPHSPQRAANSIGLVVERKRLPGEMDSLQWYCEKCEAKLYSETFALKNIETQFPAVFDRYYKSEHTKCKACGHLNGKAWGVKS